MFSLLRVRPLFPFRPVFPSTVSTSFSPSFPLYRVCFLPHCLVFPPFFPSSSGPVAFFQTVRRLPTSHLLFFPHFSFPPRWHTLTLALKLTLPLLCPLLSTYFSPIFSFPLSYVSWRCFYQYQPSLFRMTFLLYLSLSTLSLPLMWTNETVNHITLVSLPISSQMLVSGSLNDSLQLALCMSLPRTVMDEVLL